MLRSALALPLLSLAALAALAAPASASDLKLNNQVALTAAVGAPLTMKLTGPALKPAIILVDIGPGPATIGGESVPLAFSPFARIIASGFTSSLGVYNVPGSIPDVGDLGGLQVHFVGVVLDSADPNGKDWSNGASLSITLSVGAGPPTGGLVGRVTTFDGSAATGIDDALPFGTSLNWTVLQKPAGSSATLTGANLLTPTLKPDQPGDYLLRSTLTSHTTSVSSDTTLHAWRVTLTGLPDGSILSTGSVLMQGLIEGPPVAAVKVDGVPVFVAANTFGPVARSFAPGAITLPVVVELQHADGSIARQRLSFVQGSAAAVGAPSANALSARLNQAALDQMEALGATELQGANIQGPLLAMPPQLVANDEGIFGFTIFSAWVDFTGISYNPNIQLALVPSASGILATVTIHNVVATFDTWGEVLEVDYNLDGYISTSPTVITATLVGSAAGGQIQVAVTNVQVDRQNFDFELNGFLGTVAEVFVIESAVKEDVEAIVAQTISQELGPAIQEILGSFVLAGNLFETLDVDVNIAAPITGVVHDTSGVTIRLASTAGVGVAEPGSPVVPFYRATPAAGAAMGANTPGGQSYGAGLALADDFANQVLAAATGAGLLDGDLTTLVPSTGKVAINFVTEELALLFPNCGFDLFPDGTPITLRAHGTVPPILRLTPGGPAMGVIDIAGLQVAFEAPGAAGPVPLLYVTADGSATLDVAAGGEGTLSATLVDGTLVVRALGAFPGANYATIDVNAGLLGTVLEQALPQIVEALGGIPLPSLEAQGLGLSASSVAILGGGAHLAAFGQLVVTP
ncbi:MAG: hypothetical protein ACT4PU_11820 [Planctomycetota bacterium]